MDRTLLERIVAPLEHMLKTQLTTVLETPPDRAAASKKRWGVLSLSREGGEIVLTLADDGRGVNVEAVRKKLLSVAYYKPMPLSVKKSYCSSYSMQVSQLHESDSNFGSWRWYGCGAK